jgi:cellulose synthase/poly-beta-1,6-N-acetylglucosamine synthase-like glycosyltransferase
MSLQIKGKPQPLVTLVLVLAIGIIIGLTIRSVGYFWVMLVPNVFLLVLTVSLLMAYFHRTEPSKAEPETFPSLSVLIPSYNSKSTIVRTIGSIQASDYPGKMELIVVDDGSTDGSREMLKGMKGITPLMLDKNGGKARALNTAMKLAKGEVVACVDSDSYPEPSAFRKAVAALYRDDRNGAVTCFIRVDNPDSLLKKIQDIEYLTGFGFSQTATNAIEAIFVTPGPTTIFKKKVLDELGGFDEDNITEDLEMAWRLRKHGYRIDYTPEALVYTDVPDTLGKLYKQRMRWYRGKFFNLRKHSDMLFNPQYGLFGMFVLPFSFSAELSGIVLSFSFIYLLSRGLLWFYTFMSSNLALGGSILNITGMLGLGMSAMVMGLLLLSPWFLVVYLSHVIGRKQFKLSEIPVIGVFFLFYGVLISFFYCIGFFQEINHSDYRWK